MYTENKPKVMQLASVASMIDLFNKENITILEGIGFSVDVSANFQEGSITSIQRVSEFRRELEEKGIRVFDVPIPRSIFKIKQMAISFKKLKYLADNNHYKIVHVHSPIGGVIGRLAFRKARQSGTKVVYTAHGFHFFDGASLINWILFYPIERFCSRFTDILITINHEDYKRALSWNTCHVEYVPGIGVDTETFIQDENREKLRNSLNLSDEDFVFMSTGQISVRKNHEVFIRALARVNEKRIKYVIVGFGELEQKLMHLAHQLGLADRIIFTGYRDDVKDLLHAVDAFAFPSLQEGLPVAMMEAMSAGLPILCSRIRGNTDLIRDGEGGYLYDCNDIEGFTEGILKIAFNPKAKEMGKINIETMKRYDKRVINEKMTAIYESLADTNT